MEARMKLRFETLEDYADGQKYWQPHLLFVPGLILSESLEEILRVQLEKVFETKIRDLKIYEK